MTPLSLLRAPQGRCASNGSWGVCYGTPLLFFRQTLPKKNNLAVVPKAFGTKAGLLSMPDLSAGVCFVTMEMASRSRFGGFGIPSVMGARV